MTLWLVRSGKYGEREQIALDNGIAVIGWEELPDITKVNDKDKLREVYESTYPDSKKNKVNNEVSQIWTFAQRIQTGDLVAMPSKFTPSIAIGKVTGGYKYRTDLGSNVRHTRAVQWLKTDIPRTAFDQDLLYSLGAFMTVCKIERNNAENRVQAILAGKQFTSLIVDLSDVESSEGPTDVERLAQDQIMDHLQKHFKGHKLAGLVEAVLQAEGYVTRQSEAGPDGGVDILAGSGPMGFHSPRLCVQVKSSNNPADVTVLRNLQGILKTFGADQGLLVSWGGFNKAVLEEAKRSFFTIRLWDSDTLFEAITRSYDRLPETLQAELPLKRVWALVIGDE